VGISLILQQIQRSSRGSQDFKGCAALAIARRGG
jgi:hypothetical protein